jgi:hypothetical protein
METRIATLASRLFAAILIAVGSWASAPAAVPDRVSNGSDRPSRMLPLFDATPPAQALDRALHGIAASYGEASADFVALTMEYPR